MSSAKIFHVSEYSDFMPVDVFEGVRPRVPKMTALGTIAKCRLHRGMSESGGEAENICEAPGDRQGVESASLLR
jgi:hypothetical protein